MPQYTGLTLVVALENELALMESMKELFKVHEETLQSIDSISSKLNKTESGKAVNKVELVADLRRQLEEKQHCLMAFYKGIVFFTLPSIARLRSTILRRLSSGLVCANLTSTHTLQQACLTFFSEVSIAPTQAIVEICRTLELLCVKQLDNIPLDPELEVGRGSPSVACSGSFSAGLLERAQALGEGKLALTTYASNSFDADIVAASAGGPKRSSQTAGAQTNHSPASRGDSALDGLERQVVPPPPPLQPTERDAVRMSATTPQSVSEKAKSILDGLMGAGTESGAGAGNSGRSDANIKARAADSGIWGDDNEEGDI